MADQGHLRAVISDGYLEDQKTLHEQEDYGIASLGYGPLVSSLIERTGATEVLDYGAGKGRLVDALKVNHSVDVILYDPAIEGIDDPPDPCDLVVCIDVLEHIEPDLLDNVLDDLQRVTSKVGLFTVATGPAVKTLPDGRNAHLIQEDLSFWLPKIWNRFEIKTYQANGPNFWVIVNAF